MLIIYNKFFLCIFYLAKCGIKKTDSDLATALRTTVVLAFAWIMVFVVGSQSTITKIDEKSIIFLIVSGFATGASWICYFKALSLGDINKVVPIAAFIIAFKFYFLNVIIAFKLFPRFICIISQL